MSEDKLHKTWHIENYEPLYLIKWESSGIIQYDKENPQIHSKSTLQKDFKSVEGLEDSFDMFNSFWDCLDHLQNNDDEILKVYQEDGMTIIRLK